MRVLLYIFCLTFYSTTNASEEHTNSNVTKEVMVAFDSLVQASTLLDTDAYFQHFDTEKFVGLNSDGTNWNSIADLVPLIEGGFNSVKTVDNLEFTNVKISVIDPYTAVLVNEFKQTVTLKSGEQISVSGGGTQVWSNRSGHWKLVSVSASNKPQS